MHDHHGHHHHNASENIKVAIFLNLFFAIIELIGGFWTQSVAILADAIHDIGDTLSLGLGWYLQKKSEQHPDQRFTYGYRRYSLLSAVIIATFLFTSSIFVMIESIERLFNPVQPHAAGMIGFALLGIVVNGYAAWKVSHGETLNEKAISWHMIEDVLGWVAVLIAAIFLYFFDIPVLDPLLSIGYTLFILYGVGRTLMQVLELFLQGTPKNLDLETLKEEIAGVENVIEAHDCHAWSLDGENHIITLHLVLEEEVSLNKIQTTKETVRDIIKKHGKFHITIEIEFHDHECPSPCGL